MNEIILKINNLNKHYNQAHIIKDASLTVKKGGIYGFVGQNGSGKTTIIRLIMGLAFGDKEGCIELFGKTDEKSLSLLRRKIDGVVENPSFYPNFTAKQNLIMKCKFLGLKNYMSKIEELLTLVKLDKTGKKKVKNFSLGMKQRLAIATSLISDPEFLILDEPTNGLDPAGIKEIRELLLTLAKEHNLTILVSSHLLAELKLLVDYYIVIRDGHIIDEFEAKDLDNRFQKQLMIQATPINQAIKVLKGLQLENIKKEGDFILTTPPKDVSVVTKELVMGNVKVNSIRIKNVNTEEYFMDLMGGGNHA